MPEQPTAMVSVHTAYGMPEAELIRSVLESAGMEVLTTAAGAGVAYGFTVGPMARVEIFVHAGDAEMARTLITEMQGEADEPTEPPAPATPAD